MFVVVTVAVNGICEFYMLIIWRYDAWQWQFTKVSQGILNSLYSDVIGWPLCKNNRIHACIQAHTNSNTVQWSQWHNTIVMIDKIQ